MPITRASPGNWHRWSPPIRVRGFRKQRGPCPVPDPARPPGRHVVGSDDGHPWRLLALLIAVTSIGPLSLNILTPAMPGMIVSLGADPGVVQLTLSLYLAGMAISQLVLGPLSDRFG